MHFAQSLAKTGVAWLKKDTQLQGQEWQANDRLIWYNLFKQLMQSDDPTFKTEAIKILTKNTEHIPYKSLCQNFSDADEVDPNTNLLLTKIFETMSSQHLQGQIMRGLSEVQIHNLDLDEVTASNQYVRITGEDDEAPEDADETWFGRTKVRCDECGKGVAERLGVVYFPKTHTILHKHELEKRDLEISMDRP